MFCFAPVADGVSWCTLALFSVFGCVTLKAFSPHEGRRGKSPVGCQVVPLQWKCFPLEQRVQNGVKKPPDCLVLETDEVQLGVFFFFKFHLAILAFWTASPSEYSTAQYST